jgi:O-antigen/teichoic acid export membrane protein
LYGSEFPLIIALVLIFALAATFTFVYSIYSWFAAAQGIQGVRVVAVSTIIISVLNIGLSYSLIPIFGLYGAVFSSIISYTAGLSSIYLGIKNLLK